MSDIKEIMLDLVSVQSDTGTAMEKNIAAKIAGYFENDPYFAAHPDCWGMTDTGDHLGRPVIWALKKGRSPRTLIITGHYDAVEIESYGGLRDFALQPEALREAIKSSGRNVPGLDDPDWVFGRGTADMKGGLAVGIAKVLSHPADRETGLLFAAVCDEENLSAGARSAASVLLAIRDKFGFEFAASIIPEPQLALGGASDEDEFMIYNGSIGKVMPAVVTRGVLSHCGEPVKGLSGAHLAAEIACRLDLNCDLTTSDLGLTTQAPIVTMVRDLKTTYDVSVPEYGALMLNLLFLGEGKVEGLLAKIVGICQEASDAVMARYEKAYEHSFHAGLISPAEKVSRQPLVLTLGRLEEMAAQRLGAEFGTAMDDFSAHLREEILFSKMTLQTASIEYIKKIIELSGYQGPLVVVGISPPYYPCVCNEYLPAKDGGVLETVRRVVEDCHGLKLKVVPYFTGIGDASYMSCTDPEAQQQVMKNLTLPQGCYDIPFSEIAKLGAPCFFIGPRAREIHQWSERVYMPDLEVTVPEIIDQLLRTI